MYPGETAKRLRLHRVSRRVRSAVVASFHRSEVACTPTLRFRQKKKTPASPPGNLHAGFQI
jgi:hypothetical protein